LRQNENNTTKGQNMLW